MAGSVIIEVNLDVLPTRFRRLKARMEQELQKASEVIGDQLVEDILSNKYSSNPDYSMAKEQFFHAGVIASLQVKKTDDGFTVGFSSSIMDQATSRGNKSRLGYWRLFEYGGRTKANPAEGQRVGASENY